MFHILSPGVVVSGLIAQYIFPYLDTTFIIVATSAHKINSWLTYALSTLYMIIQFLLIAGWGRTDWIMNWPNFSTHKDDTESRIEHYLMNMHSITIINNNYTNQQKKKDVIALQTHYLQYKTIPNTTTYIVFYSPTVLFFAKFLAIQLIFSRS